jgi:hypothetical protein
MCLSLGELIPTFRSILFPASDGQSVGLSDPHDRESTVIWNVN